MRGVKRLATGRSCYGTVAIDVCLLFKCSHHIFFNVFPFPVCKAQLIGDWYENRRGAPKCLVRFFLFCPPIGNFYMYFVPNKFVNFLCRGHLCANILAHRCLPPPIGNVDQAW
jgi:hypothetical protein